MVYCMQLQMKGGCIGLLKNKKFYLSPASEHFSHKCLITFFPVVRHFFELNKKMNIMLRSGSFKPGNATAF